MRSTCHMSQSCVQLNDIKYRGKMITTEKDELPEGNAANEQESYKLLEIPQVNGNHKEAARK